MSDELNSTLKRAYYQFKDDPDSPVPVEDIKLFLSLEGISLDEDNEGDEF